MASCNDHCLNAEEHCEEMERMLHNVGDPFLSGEGDSPADAVRRLRSAYDEVLAELAALKGGNDG